MLRNLGIEVRDELINDLLTEAIVPLRSKLVFGLVFSVIFQEVFRFLIYKLLRKAESGLKKVTDNSEQITSNKHILAYVAGAFSLVNVLADAVGPATMGLKDGTDMFFLTSAATALCFILLHTFWSVIFFSALDNRNYVLFAWVLGSHMLVSALTLFNQNELYLASLLPAYAIMVTTACIAYYVAGGTLRSFAANISGNGLVDEAEFLQWVGRIQALSQDTSIDDSDDITKDLIAAFRVFDRDCNGYITKDELKTAMDMIGESVTEVQLNELIAMADIDHDGRINYEGW
ncbi:Gamma-secretase subunit Aph-1 [Blattella germanica]|nr:Gamma-secretase subunit Aph-1 [Blattella germanica]